jgi:hypothetical protein
MENTAVKLKYGLFPSCCLSILLVVVFCYSSTASFAQDATVTVSAVLVKDLHVKRVKVGDTIQAKTTSAMALKDGKQLKEGARLIGHITTINVKADKTTPSQIGVVFDKV